MPDSLKDKIDQLDLAYLIDKVCSEHYPLPRWPSELATTGLMLYKRFLYLLAKYQDEKLVPTRDIDEFWHNHILYTRRYHQDCQNLCGHFIHHAPSDPTNPADLAMLEQNFARTQALYESEFGEPLQVLIRE